MSELDDLLANGDARLSETDVLPPQADEFSSPQTRERRDLIQRPERVAGGGVEETRPSLLPGR